MNTLNFIAAVVLLLFVGCATDGIQSIGVEASGNAQTQDWSVGVVIVFKSPPPDFVLNDLKAAGAVRLATLTGSDETWILSAAGPLNVRAQNAIGSSLTVPGTIVSKAPQ